MTAARTDSNQRQIVAALRKAGFSVCILSGAGHGGVAGCPDLLCARAGVNYLLEVKAPGGKLTPAQYKWHADWPGQVDVVRTVDDALRTVGAVANE
jgi:hypothetical protein